MLFFCLLSKRKRRRRKLLGAVCFLVKSLSLRLINDCDEATESVTGDGERKNGFIWSWARVERARKSRVSCWGERWGGGIPVCSVRGWGADWRTLTSAQQEQLDSITQSTEGSHAAQQGPDGSARWSGATGSDRINRSAIQHNAEQRRRVCSGWFSLCSCT